MSRLIIKSYSPPFAQNKQRLRLGVDSVTTVADMVEAFQQFLVGHFGYRVDLEYTIPAYAEDVEEPTTTDGAE